MSLMTSGVKIFDEPRMYFCVSAGPRARAARPVAVRGAAILEERGLYTAMALRAGLGFLDMVSSGWTMWTEWTLWTKSTMSTSQHQLFLAGLQIVVVPQLLAGDDLLEMVDAVRWK